MADNLTNPESVSTSAGHRDGVSLLPWQVRYVDVVADVTGAKVAACFRHANAALIVEAVNNYHPLIQERRRLIGELDAAKVHAENEERWAEAESSRLRALIRRLAEYIRREGSSEVCITSTDPKQNYHVKSADLLREARKALGEHEP